MAVRVMIPTALRPYAEGSDTIDLPGDDVGQVLSALGENYPQLKVHIFADDGTLRNFVNVFVNDTNIRDGENAATPVREGDEITIVPAIAGG